jgi:uncharacterized membrane protein
MKKVLSKILQFFKTLAYGLYPAVLGLVVAAETHYAAQHIIGVTSGSGWPVVGHFLAAIVEIAMVIILLLVLGDMHITSNNWIVLRKHTEQESTQTTDSSSDENETSDETTDTSSKTKSKGKRKKS